MLRDSYPLYLSGRPITPNHDLVVANKYTRQTATRVARADRETIEKAIAAAVDAFDRTKRMAGFERKRVLDHVVKRVEQRSEEFAKALAVEAGKPIRDSRGEITRLIDTFRI